MCYILHMSNIHPSWAMSIFWFQCIIVSISIGPLLINSDNVGNIDVIGWSGSTPNIPGRGTFTQLPGCYCPKPTQHWPQSATITSCKCSADCPEIGSSCIVKIPQLVQVYKSVWQMLYCDVNCGIVVFWCELWYCGVNCGIVVLQCGDYYCPIQSNSRPTPPIYW